MHKTPIEWFDSFCSRACSGQARELCATSIWNNAVKVGFFAPSASKVYSNASSKEESSPKSLTGAIICPHSSDLILSVAQSLTQFNLS